ncbi:dynein axonemal intermediate chain 4-like [Uloborus diversus]|uniref:dynein axonemal intermediate chain 4-like n=1 Tax=Uloborus diversus TaxID=327109 RepID=UPI002409120E|nr:dynein axonemal intermediate chain 4-like [Uloborus diversus]
MVSLIIGDWIEEGYSSIVQGKEDKSEASLVPCITNDAGENVTPKPLFPVFVGETGLDSEFLVEYLEVIENCFRSGKNVLDCESSFLKRFKKTLYVTEKALNYNTYKKSILSYNGYETQLEDIMMDSSSSAFKDGNESDEYSSNSNIKLHLLFYLEKINHNYKVTCMECSSSNDCIFVAGYGAVPEKETLVEPKGFILCWNIHKSGYPERIYHTDESVSCIEISKKCPYLIAVGMRHGLVALYDLREQEKLTKVDNRSSPVRPIGTITSVCWMEKQQTGDRQAAVILSSSKDGVICYWTVEQVLEGQVFRHIKRGSTSSKEKERKYLIAIDAAAWGMQMRPDLKGVFTIATAEGQVLVADCNDPVIYIKVYDCHNGPVFDLQWSPLANDVFMTCSTDQTVCIWQWDKPSPVKTLKLSDAVLKIAWSNVTSTLFLVMMRMKIQIFNLSQDLHEPIAQVFAPEGVSFTYITFCKQNNWFLVGKSSGDIVLYELVGITLTNENQILELKSTFLPDL